MSPAQRRRVAALAAVFATVTGPALAGRLSAGAAACAETGRVVSRADGWEEVRPPAFDDPSGVPDIKAYAVAASESRFLYVTNGMTVLGSADGGCTWNVAYRADRREVSVGQLLPAATRQVVSIEVARRDRNRVYLLLADGSAATSGVQVAVSRDGGETFTESLAGLPPAGIPGRLALSLQRDTAYVSVDGVPGADGTTVYVTRDGGQQWTRRGSLPGGVAAMAVDPRAADRLWIVSDGAMLMSNDAGETFQPVDGLQESVTDVAVGLTEDSTRLAAPYADKASLYHSGDDGEDWATLPAVARSTTAAVADELALVALGTGRGVHLALPDSGVNVDVSPDRAAVDDLSFTATTPRGVDLYARAPRSLLRREFRARDVASPDKLPQAPKPPVDIGVVEQPPVAGASLQPVVKNLTIQPGRVEHVDYTLALPPVPTPLDVVFLVDTTGSMGGAIDGMRSGIGDIVRSLARSGTDARFALVDFRDYAIAPWGTPGDFPYKLVYDLGPANDELEDAIEMLEAGGGGDGPEANLTALYQAATGRGEAINGVTLIEPGQGVTFRPGSLRVFVMITDTNSHRDDPTYPGPTFEETARALRSKGVKQVGIAVSNFARDDLAAVATETATFAPEGGVDCDNNRSADVKPGDPLVCDGTGPGLAPAIVGLLKGVRDEADIAMEPTGAGLVTVLTPAATDVNVREPQTLRYRARIACRPEQYGQTLPAGVQGVSRGRVLATARLTVTCAGPPVAAVVHPYVPPPPQRPPVAAAVVPPPPPPPAPVTNVNPNPNPNPQVNPQPHVQPQAGMAPQQREQAQLALAEAEAGVEWELEMSDNRRETDPALAWAAAGLITAGAAGAAAATRRRTAVARVTR